MKYYDIHTHKSMDASVGEDCFAIHNLSQDEMKDGYSTASNQYYSCGMHPWYIDNTKITMADIHQLAIFDKKIVAIGECGLDKLIDTPIEIQKKVFEEQIALAEKLGLPMIIHCVKAWDELLELHKKHKPQSPWILHGFRGGARQAEQLKKFGFYFSLGEHFNAESLAIVYPDRLFLETDDSCINIHNVYSRVSEALACNIDEILKTVEQNVNIVFDL